MIYDDYAAYTQLYKKKYGEDVLVLIMVGSFYELYDCNNRLGADMMRASNIMNIQVTRKNKAVQDISASNPLMAGFPCHALDRFLPILLDSGLTVVVVSQVTPPPNPKREVTDVFSKATYIPLEDQMIVSWSSNCVMVIYSDSDCNATTMSVASIDLGTGEVQVAESVNAADIQTILDDIQPCELILIGAGHFPTPNHKCRVFANGKDYDKDIHKLAFQNAMIKRCYEMDETNVLLSPIEFINLERNVFALIAFTSLLVYCTQHNDRACRILKKPTMRHVSDCLVLSPNWKSQLDIHLIMNLLNRCVTTMGRRYFTHRLGHPFISKDMMQSSYEKIEYWIKNRDEICHVRKALTNVYDLERLFRKVEIKTIKINEVCMIKKSLQALEDCNYSCGCICELPSSLLHIFSALSIEGRLVGYCAELDRLVHSLQSVQDDLQKVCDCMNKEYKVDFFKIDKNEKDGYFFQITPKRYKDLGNPLKKINSVGTTSVRLSHPELDAIWNKEQSLEKAVKVTSDDAYNRFIEKELVPCIGLFANIVNTVKELDFYTTCAHNAIEYRYSQPTLAPTSTSAASLLIKGLRHPYIEHKFQNIPYVKNDIELIRGDGILLYGLNSAGKSSLMKAVGIAILLAQAGLYVPATSIEFTPYTSLFCRISKGDNIESGQSTFVLEMSELRMIMKNASQTSLVLGDELCAGTEFLSALSLVAAGVNQLIKLGASFIFATHLHEITSVISDVTFKQVKTLHMDVFYDRVTGSLVYNRTLKPGQGSKCYGIEVASALDMDSTFLQDAREIRDKLGSGPVIVRSPYNRNMFSSKQCSMCKRRDGQEFHHIVEQHKADGDGFIGTGHKNRPTNLIYLCKICHDASHTSHL